MAAVGVPRLTARLDRVRSVLVAAGTLGSLGVTCHCIVNLRLLRSPSATPSRSAVKVSVLIPIRDEATNVGRCLRSVLAQQDIPHLEVIVLDDRSTDGTSQVLEHFKPDPRLTIIDGKTEPPAGWLGKSWACQRMSERATGSVLVFVDADVALRPTAVAASVEMLALEKTRPYGTPKFDAVSPYPRQCAVTMIERLVQPLLQWSWLSFLPLRLAERSARPALTAANGQLLAITRDGYDAIGGHAGVRSDVIEDVALFRALKSVGRRGAVVDGTSLASCRMYTEWSELREGYAKSLWSAFGSRAGSAFAIALLNLLYVVPPLAMLGRSRAGALGYASAVVGRAAVARKVDGRIWPDTFAHPLSILLFTYLNLVSFRRRAKQTLKWKGRTIIAS